MERGFPFDRKLQPVVEGQLLDDLRRYGVATEDLWLDWSDCCQEGHCTNALGEFLEDQSNVVARNQADEVVADGWMDFVHGGGANPLFVFWDFLTLHRAGVPVKVKEQTGIPEHIWEALPETTRNLCARADGYDSRWKNDPFAIAWRQRKAESADG